VLLAWKWRQWRSGSHSRRRRHTTTGGENENPTDADHPDHAEAVEIVFDPDRTTYRGMLEVWGRCLGG